MLATCTLSEHDVEAVADALELLAGIDEGENTDYDELRRLAARVRAATPIVHASEPADDLGESARWVRVEMLAAGAHAQYVLAYIALGWRDHAATELDFLADAVERARRALPAGR